MLRKINHLKRIILVASYCYYVLDDPIFSDEEFDKLSAKLISFGEMKTGFEDENFEDWKGETGFHFKYSKRCENSAKFIVRNKHLAKEVYSKVM